MADGMPEQLVFSDGPCNRGIGIATRRGRGATPSPHPAHSCPHSTTWAWRPIEPPHPHPTVGSPNWGQRARCPPQRVVEPMTIRVPGSMGGFWLIAMGGTRHQLWGGRSKGV